MTEEQINSTVPVILTDIATMAQLIDICSKRGAFKAEELSVVGDLFTRLAAHLPTPSDEEVEEVEESEPDKAELEQLEFNFAE
jgi:hypothetical protein